MHETLSHQCINALLRLTMASSHPQICLSIRPFSHRTITCSIRVHTWSIREHTCAHVEHTRAYVPHTCSITAAYVEHTSAYVQHACSIRCKSASSPDSRNMRRFATCFGSGFICTSKIKKPSHRHLRHEEVRDMLRKRRYVYSSTSTIKQPSHRLLRHEEVRDMLRKPLY